MWPFSKNKSRDLSEVWEGELEITIQGVGARCVLFDRDLLASHVAFVQVMLLEDECIFVNNVRKSPWRIVSFDRTAKKLTVAIV